MAFLPFLLALAQDGSAPTAPLAPPPVMDVAPTVVEPARIALTPLVDGVAEAEEWDPLTTGTDGSASFMNWEPDALHLGARIPVGKEAVFSVDSDDDGWLVGRRNLEIRLALRDGKAVIAVRQLDGSNAAGPSWVELPAPPELVAVGGAEEAGSVFLEASIRRFGDVFGTLQAGQKLGVRFDALSPEDLRAPFMPRALGSVRLALVRSAGLPEGVGFELKDPAKSVVPGERTNLDLAFTRLPKPAPQRISLRSLGGGRAVTSVVDSPFPTPDGRGRSVVPYGTYVAADARPGYAVVRGTVTGADGVPSVVDASFRIAEPVDVDLVNRSIRTVDRDLAVKGGYYVRSNSNEPVKGRVSVAAPAPLRILNEPGRDFSILTRRGRARLGFELYVPPKTSGSYPLTFTITTGSRTYVRVQYVKIGE